MNFKKKVNGSWTDIPHYIHKTSTDIITTLPANIYPNDTTATVGLKGNMSQTGTPTPDSPVMPQGTGERTGNLFDKSSDVVGYYITASTGVWTQIGSISRSILIKCEPDTTYTIFVPTNRTLRAVYFNNYPSADDVGYGYIAAPTADYINKTLTITTGSSAQYLAFFCYNSPQEATMYDEVEYFSQVMLNIGSQPLPYEPYGYKIPISLASTTTPVYLGEVQTKRKIRKLVLTGEEQWQFFSDSTGVYGTWQFYVNDVTNGLPMSSAQSNIAGYGVTATTRQNYLYGVYLVTSGTGVAFQMVGAKDTFANISSWKSYLAAQYAAGTPVTVWYVLATPTTGVVNEPLRKIGEYADEVVNISIPVTAGANTLSVDTTVQPSEVTVNYKGWHPTIVHERDNGAWT